MLLLSLVGMFGRAGTFVIGAFLSFAILTFATLVEGVGCLIPLLGTICCEFLRLLARLGRLDDPLNDCCRFLCYSNFLFGSVLD